MNTKNLKAYAPKARRQFIEAVTKRAAHFGIYADRIADVQFEGSAAVIEGRAFSKAEGQKRQQLVKRIEEKGFDLFARELAYTWFNRLAAIRYMELHDYLEHGLRVLSRPDQPAGFEIMDHAADVCGTLGLDKNKIIDLKLDGNKEEELYRELLLGQCHYLYKIMPFMFEAIDDATELLLPDNLTKTDSILHDLVTDVPEEDWQEIEVIGWLYQFYISEHKDAVIGKVVKSEDIPAATQLFTPNWIVKYLVQNSVGRQWLATYPDSELKDKMEYYIEPAEQTPEVQAQLKAITPESLDPENIKIIDPACGSGHILIEVYEILREIYLERGYRLREIPELILTRNIFGLDIDDRAVQLACFALLMKARDDDRRIFRRNIGMNVLSLRETAFIDLVPLWRSLNLNEKWKRGEAQEVLFEAEDLSSALADNRYQLLSATLDRFKEAKTFGSLIKVPAKDEQPLEDLKRELELLTNNGDSMQKYAASRLLPYLKQALILARRYDAVIANPPYMGGNGMNASLKIFVKNNYPTSKADLFAVFMERAFSLINKAGFNAQVNMQSWMFLSSYEKIRNWLIDTKTFITMAHLGARAFSQISGEVVQTTAWIIKNDHIDGYKSVFFRLIEGNEEYKRNALLSQCNRHDNITQDDFKTIPGAPISYWESNNIFELFEDSISIGDKYEPRVGLQTNDNERFLRFWHEVSSDSICDSASCREEAAESDRKWFPLIKGGSERKWFGNSEYVVNWENDGLEIISLATDLYGSPTRTAKNMPYYFRENIGWSRISTGRLTLRYYPSGYVFSDAGSCIYAERKEDLYIVQAILNSSISMRLFKIFSPTITFESGSIRKLPLPKLSDLEQRKILLLVSELVEIHKKDWYSDEASFGFSGVLFYDLLKTSASVIECVDALKSRAENAFKKTVFLQEELEGILSNSYGVKADNKTSVTLILEKYISSTPPAVFSRELVSFTIGCMMGRYSLDRDGLVYAHSDGEGFKTSVAEGAYKTFSADDDGIIPLTDQEWFEDDATSRFREFIKTVWDEENLSENLAFVAESLCLNAIKSKKSESSLDTIRRYLSTKFYKDHLKTYKKRPIYWLFSSGKEKAFECLVYLHRYNESTLSRMRTEYVTPLMGKFDAYHGQLVAQVVDASPSQQRAIEKELKTLEKKQAELRAFDENLKHYADQRISIDLDDGVKVNYGKFGNLLAEVKAVTGKK